MGAGVAPASSPVGLVLGAPRPDGTQKWGRGSGYDAATVTAALDDPC